MSFVVSIPSSAPITDLELVCDFSVAAPVTDADMFFDLVDGDLVNAEWANAGVRSRFYSVLRTSGCGKRMIDGIAYFVFTDGSFVAVSRFGIER